MANAQQSRILYIDNKASCLTQLEAHLQQNFDCCLVQDAQQALSLLQEAGPFQALVSNMSFSNTQGAEFLSQVHKLSPETVSIVLAAEEELESTVAAFAGASTNKLQVLKQSCSGEELVTTVSNAVANRTERRKQADPSEYSLLNANDHLPSAAMFDTELGIGSADAMQVELEYTHNVATRYARAYSLAIFAIDDYDTYASHYGRKAAKLSLKLAAEHIRHSCRASDRLYRFDQGPNILLILPETQSDGGMVLANRVVLGFAARSIPNSKSPHGLLTFSAGVAAFCPQQDSEKSWQALTEEAVLHLRAAHGHGGNRASLLDVMTGDKTSMSFEST